MADKQGRKTGGRQKGSRNKKTLEREEVIEQAHAQWTADNPDLPCPECPVEVMLYAMKKAWATGGPLLAFEIAKHAAPYKKPKLAHMDVKEESQVTVAQKFIYTPQKGERART